MHFYLQVQFSQRRRGETADQKSGLESRPRWIPVWHLPQTYRPIGASEDEKDWTCSANPGSFIINLDSPMEYMNFIYDNSVIWNVPPLDWPDSVIEKASADMQCNICYLSAKKQPVVLALLS